jgi:formate/nitrite transporter FocA (FNT family)
MKNWLLVLVSNFIGAIFVAYFFGHVLGLTETGPFLTKTVAIAEAKIDETFIQSVISAVGCNWLVCLGVWLAFGADDVFGLCIWRSIRIISSLYLSVLKVNMSRQKPNPVFTMTVD